MVGEHPLLVALYIYIILVGDIPTRNRPPTQHWSPSHAFVDGRYGSSTRLCEAHFRSTWAARLGAMLFLSSRRFWRCKDIQPQKTENIISQRFAGKLCDCDPAQADSVAECGFTWPKMAFVSRLVNTALGGPAQSRCPRASRARHLRGRLRGARPLLHTTRSPLRAFSAAVPSHPSGLAAARGGGSGRRPWPPPPPVSPRREHRQAAGSPAAPAAAAAQ